MAIMAMLTMLTMSTIIMIMLSSLMDKGAKSRRGHKKECSSQTSKVQNHQRSIYWSPSSSKLSFFTIIKIIIFTIIKIIIGQLIIFTIIIMIMISRSRAGDEEAKKENGSRTRGRQSYDLNQVITNHDHHDDENDDIIPVTSLQWHLSSLFQCYNPTQVSGLFWWHYPVDMNDIWQYSSLTIPGNQSRLCSACLPAPRQAACPS